MVARLAQIFHPAAIFLINDFKSFRRSVDAVVLPPLGRRPASGTRRSFRQRVNWPVGDALPKGTPIPG
jgi:hypothetical protein